MLCEFIRARGRSHVLDAGPGAVEDGDLVGAPAPGLLTLHEGAQLRMDPGSGHSAGLYGVVQVPHKQRLLQHIHDYGCIGHELGLELALVRIVGADGGDEGPWTNMLESEEWRAGGGAGHDGLAGAGCLAELVDGVNSDARLRGHAAGEGACGLRIGVPGVDGPKVQHMPQGRELDGALRATAAYGGCGRVSPRKIAGREGGRGPGALKRDLPRVQQGQGASVTGVRKIDRALDGRQPVAGLFWWGVDGFLYHAINAAAPQPARPDVEGA